MPVSKSAAKRQHKAQVRAGIAKARRGNLDQASDAVAGLLRRHGETNGHFQRRVAAASARGGDESGVAAVQTPSSSGDDGAGDGGGGGGRCQMRCPVQRANSGSSSRRIRPPEPYQRFKATVAYDGTDFKGWQMQGDGDLSSGHFTIQSCLERRLGQLLRTATNSNFKAKDQVLAIAGSGRTDAGVHARGQVYLIYPKQLVRILDTVSSHIKPT